MQFFTLAGISLVGASFLTATSYAAPDITPTVSATSTEAVSAVRARAHLEIAQRDATIDALKAKLAAQVSQIVWLQGQVRDLIAKDQIIANTNFVPPPFVDAPGTAVEPLRPGLTPFQQSAAEAISAHQVSVSANITNIFNRTAEVNFTVQNLSRRPIQFYTTPTMYYGTGLCSDLHVSFVSTVPFPSSADQINSVMAMVALGGHGVISGTMSLPGEPQSQQKSVIAPGGILYFRATGPINGNDQVPTKFTFKGGGWDDYSLNIHLIQATDFGR